jgi:hypothetical protein
MRTPYSKQHGTVRAGTRCRLAVLPPDRLDCQALLGVAEQQASRLQARNTNPGRRRPVGADESVARVHDGGG